MQNGSAYERIDVHSVYAIRTACWPAGVFASPSHTSVGSFAQSVGPQGGMYSHRVAGPHTPLFASPSGLAVRKPLQVGSAGALTAVFGGLAVTIAESALCGLS